MEKNQIPHFSKSCSFQCTSYTKKHQLNTKQLLDNGHSMTNLYDIVNSFNNYFPSIAETMKKMLNTHKIISQSIIRVKVVVYFVRIASRYVLINPQIF